MEFVAQLLDFLIHVDAHIAEICNKYQTWTYLILFLIIFAETGLVAFPFLPGDPLLFAAGAVVASGTTGINIYVLALVLFVAAVLGNQVNYAIGSYSGAKILRSKSRFLKPSYFGRTKLFFRKHGGKAVIFSRFFPILRTFVPFVAGIGKMDSRLFVIYNFSGAFLWIASFLALGFFFGNLQIVKENFGLVIAVISVFTTLPPVIAAINARMARKRKAAMRVAA